MTTAARTPFPSSDTVVVTDAGLETWLVFDRGIDLPAFAAYPLAGTDSGRALLTVRRRVSARGADLAGQSRLGGHARARP